MAQAKKRARQVSGNPAKRGTPVAPVAAPVGVRDWIGAARLRTLPLAVAPVVVGTGAAVRAEGLFHGVIALCCLVVAVALQIGVNFANDYSDGVRGTDDFRVGPARLTASGRVPARTVLLAAMGFFALAAVTGLAIVIRTGHWWLIGVGALCIVAAWFYTGGSRPYGYHGLGEVFVFLFFGLVATLGTMWVQASTLSQEAWFAAVAIGLFACAVLLANNLRDIEQDRVAGKRTLSVRIGARGTKIVYTVFVTVPFLLAIWVALFYPVALLALLALLAIGPAIAIIWTARTPRELILALALTSYASVGYAALLAWAYVA